MPDTQESAVKVRTFSAELKQRAFLAFDQSDFIEADRAPWAAGYCDAMQGHPPAVGKDCSWAYAAGFDAASAVRDMLDGNIPQSCASCGASLKPDGSCDFCPVRCDSCDAIIESMDGCTNPACDARGAA